MSTQTIKILFISYKFKNKHIRVGNLAKRVKEYYEKNSRGRLKINFQTFTTNINSNYNRNNLSPAINQTKNRVPGGFHTYVHLCNPKVSRAPGKHVQSYANFATVCHEVGHRLGLHHANRMVNGKLKSSTDPYSQMTSHIPYASMNSVHRFLKKWLLDSELSTLRYDDLEDGPKEYLIAKLKNFGNKVDTKVIRYLTPAEKEGVNKRFFISFVDHSKRGDRLVVHTLWGNHHSVLLNDFSVSVGKEYYSKQADIFIKVTERDGNRLYLSIRRELEVDSDTELDTASIECLCSCDSN